MKQPLRIMGVPASPGIAIGPARVVVRQPLRIPHKRIESGEIEHEQQRLSDAVAESRERLESAKRAVVVTVPQEKKDNAGGTP